jgi:hypothetical protein
MAMATSPNLSRLNIGAGIFFTLSALFLGIRVRPNGQHGSSEQYMRSFTRDFFRLRLCCSDELAPPTQPGASALGHEPFRVRPAICQPARDNRHGRSCKKLVQDLSSTPNPTIECSVP